MAEALKETGIPDAPAGEPARSEEELQVETASIFSDSRRELDFLYEHGLGPGRGAINIANELVNFFDFAGRTVGSAAEKISGSAVGRAALKVHPLTEQLARPGVQQFLQGTEEPLQVPRFLGESKTFMGGMNETLSQFALGLYLTSWMRLAGPATAVAGKAASLVGRVGPRKAIARLGKFNEFSLRGAIVDGGLFDPHEDTLGEIAHELGPDFLNPLTQYLASEPGDSEAERRFVNALEGLLLGGAVEGLFVASARAIRGARWLKRKVRGATAGRAEKEIIASFEEIEAAAGGQQPKVKEGDVAVARVDADNSTVLEVVDPEAARRLQETGFAGVEGPAVVNVPQGQRIGPGGAEETPKVIQRAQESVGPEEFQARAEAEAANRGVDLNDPAQAGAGSAVVEDTARKIVAESQPDVPSVRFNSRGDANAQAATFNETMQNHALPVRELTEEQETLVKQVADELKEAGDEEAVLDAMRKLEDVNLNRVGTPDDAKAHILAMSEVLGNPFQNRRIGKRGFEVITQLAMDTMDGVNTPEEALMAIRRMFQATENLDVVTLQTRMWFARMAKQAAKYSRALDMNPNDPVALVEFGRSMTYLFNMAEELTGTSANTARNLAAHRIEVVGDEVITAAASRANPEDLVKAREVIQEGCRHCTDRRRGCCQRC
jgi:hypothetical protein